VKLTFLVQNSTV